MLAISEALLCYQHSPAVLSNMGQMVRHQIIACMLFTKDMASIINLAHSINKHVIQLQQHYVFHSKTSESQAKTVSELIQISHSEQSTFSTENLGEINLHIE